MDLPELCLQGELTILSNLSPLLLVQSPTTSIFYLITCLSLSSKFHHPPCPSDFGIKKNGILAHKFKKIFVKCMYELMDE